MFEFKDLPLYKNKSHNIIPIAIYNYFVEGKPIEDTIINHRNIYDFCAGVRAKNSDVKGRSHFELHWIDNSKINYTIEEKKDMLIKKGYYEVSNGFYRHPKMQGELAGIDIKDFNPIPTPLKKQKLSKTVRYFISNKGQYLFKCYPDGTQVHVEAPLNLGKIKKDWKVTYFNKYFSVDKFEDYNIDYSYYIHKAREIIYQLEQTGQLDLFQ